MNSFNISELYSKVFGTKGVRFNSQKNGEFQVDTPPMPKAIAYSYLGTPITEQISFSLPGIENLYTFPDWPLIDISANKVIVKTPIRGRKGTIKEYISTDDYKITIRGILINHKTDEYPEDLVNELHNIFTINKELRVTNALLNLLDVHDVVIVDLRFPEVEGFNHIQPFVIECLSDRTIELVIKDIKPSQQAIPRGLT